MLRPSYSELMEIFNNESDVDSQITSRYTIVIAAAKRARQIVDGAIPLTKGSLDHVVSLAVKEMAEGHLKIKLDKNLTEIYNERQTRSYYKSFSAVSRDDLRENFKDRYEEMEISDDEIEEEEIDSVYSKDEFSEIDEEDEFLIPEEAEFKEPDEYEDE